MKTNLNRTLRHALPFILGLGLAWPAFAVKPPPPPPPPSPEPGMIRVVADGAYQLMSPTGGGADLTVLPDWWQGELGLVSRGGANDPQERWFLQFEDAAGAYPTLDPAPYPPDQTWIRPHRILVARRVADGHRVVLNDDPLLEPHCTPPIDRETDLYGWANPRFLGTRHISWVARRWDSLDPGLPIDHSPGVYVAALAFDAAGNLIGAEAPEKLPVPVGVSEGAQSNIGPGAMVYGCDWDCRTNAAGQLSVRFAYSTFDDADHSTILRRADCTQWFIDTANEIAPEQIAAGFRLIKPRWSPDGTTLVATDGRIALVNPAGGVAIMAVPGRDESFGGPCWSPSGKSVVFWSKYCKWDRFFTKLTLRNDVYQLTLATGTISNLTGSTSVNVSFPKWEVYE